MVDDDDREEAGKGGVDGWVPPHEYLARKKAVHEGGLEDPQGLGPPAGVGCYLEGGWL